MYQTMIFAAVGTGVASALFSEPSSQPALLLLQDCLLSRMLSRLGDKERL